MKLAGSSVLLTGATGGLGQAIARRLAREDARLFLTGRRTDLLESLAAELDARAVAVDLAVRDALVQLARDLEPVDILVANAALPASGELEDFGIDEIDRAIAVNLVAPILLARLLLPGMRERQRGHLVFVGSIGGKATSPLVSVYSATKFGLRGFALSLRQDLRGSGIGVSLVLPGPIRDAGMFAEAKVELSQGMATRSPEDVARAVVQAVQRDIAEVTIAAPTIRLGAALAALSPRINAALQSRGDTRHMMSHLASGQRTKR